MLIEEKIVSNSRFESLFSEEDIDVLQYISRFVDLFDIKTKFLKTSTRFNIEAIEEDKIDNIVNLKRINDIKFINKFFESANKKLEMNGLFIFLAETSSQRRKRIFGKYPKLISFPLYLLDFIVKRIFPKWEFTRKINSYLTKGLNRVLPLPEILGRSVSCGFEITDYKQIKNFTYFVVKKIKEPSYDMQPSYGIILKSKRVGMGGKTIFVYKFRTMYAYSEYLQQYVYEKNDLDIGGKFKDDFRITGWGKLLRIFWIDELPMVINLLKGELKLVGVRPITEHYLSLFNENMKQKRLLVKPGLIPPFYADLPDTLDEIMESEMKYIDDYLKNGYLTDIKYLFKSLNNILFKSARSK